MKKLLAMLLAVAFIASLGIITVSADYPLSTSEFGIAAPAEEAPPAPVQEAPAPAPLTADMHIMIALAVLVVTTVITIKLTKKKNRV